MKLWTKEVEEQAKRYPIGSQEGLGMDAHVWLKVFNPYGRGDWYITESEKQSDGDWLLYGYCHIFEGEFGYVMLSELQNTKVNVFGCQLPLERDSHIGNNATVRSLARCE